MTKGLRTTVCAAAALTLAALLVLLLTPAQARYLRTAQWQAAYPEETAEFASDFLILQGTTDILLADWSPEQNETKQVSLHLTCPAEWLQEPVTEETAEGQEAAETADGESAVKVTLGAVDAKYLQVKAEVRTDCSASDDTAKVTVTLTLTAAADKPDDKTGITVTIPLSVSFVGAKETFAGKLILTLWPAAENGTSGEESGLFNDAASMKEYDPKKPFCVQYTLPTECTAAEMTLDGAEFPAKTRYSTDNGASYTVLYEDRSSIPVTKGSTALLVDMSEADSRSGALTLRLTANGQDGKVFTDTLQLTEKDWNGSADVTYTEDGLPTMTIQPWNSGHLEVKAEVEYLAWTEDAASEGEQAGTDQQTEKQRTVAYVNAEKVIQIDWTPISVSESDDPAAGAQTMTLRPADNVSRVPAGTYRVRLCWKSSGVLVAERVIPFFVTW